MAIVVEVELDGNATVKQVVTDFDSLLLVVSTPDGLVEVWKGEDKILEPFE